MHSSEEIVHSEVCHDDAQECQGYVDVIGERFAEDRQTLRMHYHSIYHKGDESPSFLAVPTPISSPTYVCPDSTNEDTEAHGCEGWIKEDAAQCLQRLAMRTQADAHESTDEGKG